MKRYRIHTSQNLTKNGQLGVWLFLFSPIVGGASYYWLMAESFRRLNVLPVIPAVFMVAAGIAFLGGAVMVLIGRTFSHSVNEIDPAEAKQSEGLWMR